MSTSLHSSLSDDILAKIHSGELLPGDKLPSEGKLMKTYGLSKTTVSKCLQTLSNEGYIVNIPRVGNYVKKSKSTQYELLYDEENILSLLSDEVDYRDFTCAATAGGPAEITFRRVYSAEKKVIGFSDHTLRLPTGGPVDSAIAKAPLDAVLGEHYHLHSLKKSIAIGAAACPEDAAGVLGIAPGSVILIVERGFCTLDGTPAALCRTHCRDQLFDLHLTSKGRS